MQGNHLQEEVNRIVAGMDNQNEQDDLEQGISPIDEPAPLQDIYVYIVREHDEAPEQPQEEGIIETTLAPHKPSLLAIAVCFFALLLPLASIIFQLSLALNPFTATVTIFPKSQQIVFNGTLQTGRILAPITLSQSQTVPTTGTGHQDASAATGFITLYNGLFTEQTVAAGTLFTVSDGVQVVIHQNAVIPAAIPDPLAFGQVTVAAQATGMGSRGNIAAYDINQTCCASGILAKNTTAFHGGQDERDFQTVSQADIDTPSTLLKTHLSQELTTALQKQLTTGDVMLPPACTLTGRSDHQPGDEAATVNVTVSATCSAVAYNQDGLRAKVTDLLQSQAAKKLGAGYRIRGNPHIIVTSATPAKQVTLAFRSVSAWGYVLSSTEQTAVKKVIAGCTMEHAMQLLASFPGIETATIKASGFGDDTRLPKDPRNIALVVLSGMS